MASEYVSSLDYLAQKRYSEKYQIEGVTLPDPYELKDEIWSEDLSLWPDLQFSDIYTYLIETKGQYTREDLKAYKSLESYSYYYNGHVRTVYCYTHDRFVITKAKVNPSQKSPQETHTPWVIIHRASAEIKTAHCNCKAGLVIRMCCFVVSTVSKYNYFCTDWGKCAVTLQLCYSKWRQLANWG